MARSASPSAGSSGSGYTDPCIYVGFWRPRRINQLGSECQVSVLVVQCRRRQRATRDTSIVADLRTTVTELVTGLGMLGHTDIEAALNARPPQMVSVSPERWTLLVAAYEGGALAAEFDAAFANGRAFLNATDGLRGRIPEIVEWKGAQGNPGDEALPVDLRIDHVFLISCKYLSRILHNASPQRVFEHSLRSTQSSRNPDWFGETAMNEYQTLYERTVKVCNVPGMPTTPTELTKVERLALRATYPKTWPTEVVEAYAHLCEAVSTESARRWAQVLESRAEQELTLWRLLRFGPAPYFVLGSSASEALRLRIATPWDWRQHFALQRFDVSPRPGGQPMVTWTAQIKARHSGLVVRVDGHVEIRWSHGRFGGVPEAKVYLDTPHQHIPGYFPIA